MSVHPCAHAMYGVFTDTTLSSYIMWYSGGVWEHETVKGTVTTKLKGVSMTNGSGIFENAGNVTWDEAEYVIPPRVRWITCSYYLSCICIHISNCVCRSQSRSLS